MKVSFGFILSTKIIVKIKQKFFNAVENFVDTGYTKYQDHPTMVNSSGSNDSLVS